MLQNSLHSTAEYIKLYRRISKMLPRNSWESICFVLVVVSHDFLLKITNAVIYWQILIKVLSCLFCHRIRN